jgi:hypothetical protein
MYSVMVILPWLTQIGTRLRKATPPPYRLSFGNNYAKREIVIIISLPAKVLYTYINTIIRQIYRKPLTLSNCMKTHEGIRETYLQY